MLGFKRSMIQAIIVLTWASKYLTFGNLVLWYFFTILLAAAVVLAVTTYDHDYWASRGVYSPPALPIVGHILQVARLKEQGGICFKNIYDQHKNKRYLGTHQFYQRTLVVCDPELIKRICVNDFQHFMDRGFFFNKEVDPLAGSVLFLRGNDWKRLRAKISPIFSPNKLRSMFPLIDNTANDFVSHIRDILTKATDEANTKYNNNLRKDEITNGNVIPDVITGQGDEHSETVNIEIKDNINRIKHSNINNYDNKTKEYNVKENSVKEISTNESITKKNCIKANGVTQNRKNATITINGKGKNKSDVEEAFSAVVDSEKLVGGYTADAIVPCAFGLKSGVMYNDRDPFAVALQAFYEKSVYNIFEKTMQQFWPAFALFFRMRIIPKKTHDFFYNIVTSVLRAREKGEQEKRGDFIDMMMGLRNDDNNNNNKVDGDDVEITDMVISANAFIIFLGGFETTSSTLAFLCLELAAHSHVQDKMRREILDLLERRGELNYEMLQELTYMEMVIQETLRLYPPFPNIQRMCTKDYTIPGTDTVVEKGTIVLFPTLGIQRDEKYFPAPSSFSPERWATSAPPPGVYMPFGDGPRYCIGKRFAMIQMKCCLVRLLQRVRISPASPSMLAERRAEPFAPDTSSPHTLHPADSLIRLTLL